MKKYLLIVLLLASCYSEKKATQQINKAAVSYPVVLARKARDLFPCVNGKGDTLYISDSTDFAEVLQSLQDDNYRMFLFQDSLLNILQTKPTDSLCFKIVDDYLIVINNLKKQNKDLIERVKHLPAIRDTIKLSVHVIDQAAVQVCEEERQKVVGLLETASAGEREWRGKAHTYFWIILALGAIIGISVYSKFVSFFKPKINVN